MALEDYLEPEVGVAVAITAAMASPKVRGYLRRGAVYGLAGVLKAGDALSAAAGGVKRGVQNVTAEARAQESAAETPSAEAPPEPAEASPRRTRKTPEAENA